MVITSLTGRTVTPDIAADWMILHGGRAYVYYMGVLVGGDGTYFGKIAQMGRDYGLTVEAIDMKNDMAVVNALTEGKKIIVLMGSGRFTSGGHYIVLSGYSNGMIIVNDSSDVSSRYEIHPYWYLKYIQDEMQPVTHYAFSYNNAEEIIEVAQKYIGRDYSSMDCSSLTRNIFRDLGFSYITGTADGQARECAQAGVLHFYTGNVSELRPGDLLFWQANMLDATHCGNIYCCKCEPRKGGCRTCPCQRSGGFVYTNLQGQTFRAANIHHVGIYIGRYKGLRFNPGSSSGTGTWDNVDWPYTTLESRGGWYSVNYYNYGAVSPGRIVLYGRPYDKKY